MTNILCLNSGSSSLKFAVYRSEGATQADQRVLAGSVEDSDIGRAMTRVREALNRHAIHDISAVGHRVVHGGPDCTDPQRVTPELMSVLNRCIPFAPLHLPPQLDLMETIARDFPDLPQVACFDTAFHRRMPEVAQRFPLPRSLWDAGIRRYGFHGLSFEFILTALGKEAGRRLVIAHLGNGVSMAAVREGAPVDTTMGLTPSGGMMMSTRSGDLDPGILMHLMREHGCDSTALHQIINRESGLLGVSGVSGDMRVLLQKRSGDAAASLAVEMFCYQARKCIAALSATLGGMDMLVFTGGIGEHAAPVRSEICGGLEYLGIVIDEARNEGHEGVISPPYTPCEVRVLPTDEERMIAHHTRAVLRTHF